MDFFEAVAKRRTVRKFKGIASDEQLDRILQAAVMAPSTMNRQNWEFVVVDEPALIAEIAELKYIMNRGGPIGEAVSEDKERAALRQKASFDAASLVVVFCNQTSADAAGVWCCVENMLLAAVAEGLGARIARLLGDAAQKTNALLKAPENMQALAAVSIGIPAEDPAPRKLRPDRSWLHRNRF